MAAQGDPDILRRRMRRELRQARENTNLSQQKVADKLDWSLSKVVRIENGSVNISTTDLRALISLYNIEGTDEGGKLLAAAKASRERPWWHKYKDAIRSQFAELVAYESAATAVRAYHPTLIPALLQTMAYATEIREQNPACVESELALRLELLQKRQESMREPAPPVFTFVLDEAALHRWIGGPAAMRDQLLHLRKLAERPSVTISVLPLSAGAHGSLSGPMVLIDLPDGDGRMLFLEGSVDDLMVREDDEMIGRYETIFRRLEELSLPEPQSVRLLEELIDGFAKEM